jgi:toxin ParE1/3/4
VIFELTLAAERDIRDILRETLKMFGTVQLSVYQRIISTGIALVAEQPERPESRARPELGAEIRVFHLELAAGRRGGAAHCLYYTPGRLSDGSTGTVILRVLHEHMEPRHKVIRSLP